MIMHIFPLSWSVYLKLRELLIVPESYRACVCSKVAAKLHNHRVTLHQSLLAAV